MGGGRSPLCDVYVVYTCVLGFGHAVFLGVLCLALCFVVWVARGRWRTEWSVLCEELIQNSGKYCPMLSLKMSRRLMASSDHQRVGKYCK